MLTDAESLLEIKDDRYLELFSFFLPVRKDNAPKENLVYASLSSSSTSKIKLQSWKMNFSLRLFSGGFSLLFLWNIKNFSHPCWPLCIKTGIFHMEGHRQESIVLRFSGRILAPSFSHASLVFSTLGGDGLTWYILVLSRFDIQKCPVFLI